MARIQILGKWRRWNLAAALLAAGLFSIASATHADEPGEFKIEIHVSADADGGNQESLPATHQQSKFVLPTQGDARLSLTSFCLTKDGKVIAILNRQEQGHAGGGVLGAVVAALSGGDTGESATPAQQPTATTTKALDSAAEVRILDADGKLLDQWALDFKGQAVNLCPDGNLIIGGDGVLARYDLKGKELARSESPHIAATRKDPDELKRMARETLQQQRDSIQQALKSFEAQKEELAKKDEKSLTDEERQAKQQADQIIVAYKRMADQQGAGEVTEAQVNETAEQLAGMGRKINAVAASDKHLYCTAPASKGYGYSVWRTELDFSQPQRIVDGLSGCCGQMDIQCCGDEVIVSENSRKRVVRYDANGKELASWGKASRDGEGDTFGSCCNPMNTRSVGDKLYVSDSDGRVRLFTLDGKYQGEVGKANVQPGCKSSIVDISPDGNRLYYIDVNNSRICVLDRKPAGDAQAAR